MSIGPATHKLISRASMLHVVNMTFFAFAVTGYTGITTFRALTFAHGFLHYSGKYGTMQVSTTGMYKNYKKIK